MANLKEKPEVAEDKVDEAVTPVIDTPTANPEVSDNSAKTEDNTPAVEPEVSEGNSAEGNEPEGEPEVSEDIDTAMLTNWDLRSRINEACRAKLGMWCYPEYWFPASNEVWVDYSGRKSELDFKRFTYTVGEDDVVTVSEPEDVKLTVSVAEINTKVAEFETTIAEKDDVILKSASEITDLKSEITNLSQYKEKFEKAEQEKVEAELAEQKKTLIAEVVKSGLISAEEIEASEELTGFVNQLDKKSLMQVVGEKLLASLANKEETPETASVEVETSTHVPVTNLNSSDEGVDGVSLFRSLLRK